MTVISPVQMETAIPKTKSLLRRNKYYVRATNDTCANCEVAKHGCCMPGLSFSKDDFKMDFTCEEQIKVLVDLGVFIIWVDNGKQPHVGIRINNMQISRYVNACVFWSETGCRLAYDAKPKVCRVHRCERISYNLEVKNKRDHNRTYYLKASRKRIRINWTSEESQAVYNVTGCRMTWPPVPTYEQAEAYDWEHILTVLQGGI